MASDPLSPCPSRVEVPAGTLWVNKDQVKAWVAHLESHGWTKKDLDPKWLVRARTGVDRNNDGSRD